MTESTIRLVIVDHAEWRGFCAGGDVTLIRRSALEDRGAAARHFFDVEYKLNTLMFTYEKPIVAFMDGITMGGGVGISQPARYRVATENTRFAMPESIRYSVLKLQRSDNLLFSKTYGLALDFI